MKLDKFRFSLAIAAASALLRLVCSLFVFLMPRPMMNVTGHMMHGDFNTFHWTLTPFGVFYGLIAWTLFGGLLGWLIAFFYNNFAAGREE